MARGSGTASSGRRYRSDDEAHAHDARAQAQANYLAQSHGRIGARTQPSCVQPASGRARAGWRLFLVWSPLADVFVVVMAPLWPLAASSPRWVPPVRTRIAREISHNSRTASPRAVQTRFVRDKKAPVSRLFRGGRGWDRTSDLPRVNDEAMGTGGH
jgi:hypothetical protein